MGISGTARNSEQKKVSNNIQMMQNGQDLVNIPNIQKEKSIIYENKYLIENNYIIGELYISEKFIGENVRIINSYEEYCRDLNFEIEEEYKNEEEIKECKIEINEKKNDFCYYYKFEKIGKYKIKYIFDKYLTNINHMFSCCSSLTNLNLSNFNTQNVKDMSWMFSECKSLRRENMENIIS